MRHDFALSATGPIPGLAGRMPTPPGATPALLIAAASALERDPTGVSGAGPRAVPLATVTHPAQEEELPTVRSAADDQAQRIHALPRSGREGWTTTGRYAKKGAANRALPGVGPPEGPGWSDSGPSPCSVFGGYGLPQLTQPRNGPVARPVENSALSRHGQHHECSDLHREWAALAPDVRWAHHRKAGFMAGFGRLAAGQSPSDGPSFLDRARNRWAARAAPRWPGKAPTASTVTLGGKRWHPTSRSGPSGTILAPGGGAGNTSVVQVRAVMWWPQRESNPCFSLERAVS